MTALLTPLEFGTARQLGASLWRKQLLPLGEISYKGRKIAFTRDYLAGLVQAFRAKAYDVVPLQFADAANAHTNAPEQRRGTVRDLELTDDGLDVLVEVDPDAAGHLSRYPDLGVSARIREGYDRADGKFFPAAVQHVLATLDPRIPGMRPWQAVEAANEDDGEVIDLTVMEYAATEDPAAPPAVPDSAPKAQEGEAGMAFTAEQEARLKVLLDLPEDQFAALTAAQAQEGGEGTQDGTGETGDTAGEDELTDEQLEQLLAEIDTETAGTEAGETGTGGDRELEPAGAALTAEAQAAIDLANARAEETSAELRRMRGQLDRATYEKERDHYQRVLGIPARITDLARPLLEGSGRTVDLANGASADAGAIVRKLITEVGKTFASLGMSVELGNAEGADTEQARAEAEASERTDFVKAYRSQHAL